MTIFTKAIVRTPGRSMPSGLTNANLGAPVHQKALEQHQQYIAVLESCGLEVLVLSADELYPDSTFVEDVAVLTLHCAVITRPAAPSRAGETESIRPVLERFYSDIIQIEAPGTLDGGDVLQIKNHFYIGLSARTNLDGAEQLIAILGRYGFTGSTVAVTEFLHLKTGVTWVGGSRLLASGEFVVRPEFSDFAILPVEGDSAGAANCIRINNTLLMPAGYPLIRQQLAVIEAEIIEVDISEFAKLDGGLTCLSLRF